MSALSVIKETFVKRQTVSRYKLLWFLELKLKHTTVNTSQQHKEIQFLLTFFTEIPLR